LASMIHSQSSRAEASSFFLGSTRKRTPGSWNLVGKHHFHILSNMMPLVQMMLLVPSAQVFFVSSLNYLHSRLPAVPELMFFLCGDNSQNWTSTRFLLNLRFHDFVGRNRFCCRL
jgi:hypothetical protein